MKEAVMSTEPATLPAKYKKYENKPFELDDAIEQTGHGRFHYLILVISGLCLTTVITETLSISYVLPTAQCDLYLTTQDKGMVGAICFLGMIASSHLWGFLADTVGRRKILIITLFLDGIVTLICSFSHAYWLLLLCRFFNGFFICGPSAVVYAYLGEFHPAKTRTKAIVWACGFVSLGFLILPGLAWIIIPQTWSWELALYTYRSWRLYLLICGVPSILTAVLLLLFLPETPKFLIEQGREAEALCVLKRMFTANTGKTAEEYPVKAVIMSGSGADNHHAVAPPGKSLLQMMKIVWNQTWPLFLPPYLFKTILGSSLQFGLYFCANGYILWLPEIFNRMADHELLYPDSSETVCQIMTSVPSNNNTTDSVFVMEECKSDVDTSVYFNTLINGLVMGVAFIAGGYLVNLVGKRILLVISLFIAGLAAMGTYFVHNSAEVLALSCVNTCLTGMCVSIVTSIIVDIFPTHLRAMAVCIALMMGRLGTSVSSVFIGMLIEISCASVFFFMGGLTIGCCLLVIVFTMPTREKDWISHKTCNTPL